MATNKTTNSNFIANHAGKILAALGLALAAVLAVVILTSGESEPAGADSISDGFVASEQADGATRIDVFLDYDCSWCATFEQAVADELDKLSTNGDAYVVLHPVSILDNHSGDSQFSTRAASAAVAVALRSPEHLGAFNESMFTHRADAGAEGLSDKQIADVARSVGVAEDVADLIASGEARTKYEDHVVGLTQSALENEAAAPGGQFGTPTIVIDGQRFEGNWQEPGTITQAVRGES